MSGSRLELSPSYGLAGAIVALHGIAAFSAVLAVPGAAGIGLGALLLALGLAAAWSRGLLAAAKSVRALELQEKITVELRNGERFEAELAARRHVSRYLVSLPIVRPVRRTLLVTRDMLGAQEFRRLRIWALWGRLRKVALKQLPA